MRILLRLLRDWTLPVAICCGIITYLLFANIAVLEPIGRCYAPFNGYVIPTFLFLILFVTFCKVDFDQLRPVRWHLWVSVQQVIFVCLLVAAIVLLRLHGDAKIVMESVLACIIGPCAAAAAVVTAKLGGSLEQMTTYTFLSNIVTAVMIPVFFPLIEPSADIQFLSAFLHILYEVCIVLLVPMAVAFVVKRWMPRFRHFVVSIKDLSFYLWAVNLAIVSGTTVMNICHSDSGAALLVLIAALTVALCLLQFATGRLIGRRFGASVEAGQALGQKNTAFAIWIAAAYLNPLATVGPGCYILWQNIINAIELWMCRRQGKEHYV